MNDSHRQDTTVSLLGTSRCTYAIEPPCTEPYARWCERSGLAAPPTRFVKNKQTPCWASAYLVPVAGLEPARSRHRWILRHLVHLEYSGIWWNLMESST